MKGQIHPLEIAGVIVVILLIAGVLIVFVFPYSERIWEFQEKCKTLSVQEGAESWNIDYPRCFLEFCNNTSQINNDTFLGNCYREEWRIKL